MRAVEVTKPCAGFLNRRPPQARPEGNEILVNVGRRGEPPRRLQRWELSRAAEHGHPGWKSPGSCEAGKTVEECRQSRALVIGGVYAE